LNLVLIFWFLDFKKAGRKKTPPISRQGLV